MKSTRAIWSDRVKRWMVSGLSAEAFAASEGCHPKTLSIWRWRLGEGPRARKAKQRSLSAVVHPQAFVQVLAPKLMPSRALGTQTKASAPFELTLASGALLVVPAHFDREALQTLVELVGGA